MRRTTQAQILLPAIALAFASCTAWALQTGFKLSMDGHTLSTDVQMIHSRPYVPLSDVAAVLGMNVAKKGDTYILARAGGAHQIRGATGKITTNIFNGTWLLNVESAQQVMEYSQLYGSDKARIVPTEVGDVLIVVKCRLKNGTQETQEVYFDKDSTGDTSLTDDQSHDYVPLAYDSRNSSYTSAMMLPGSEHDFVVIFSVPKGAVLKDLIYSVLSAGGQEKGTDFRVSLKS